MTTSREPLVTLCIPTIGRLEFLNDTRNSIEAQTYANLEILVLDNCRQYASSEVLNAWAQANPKVKVLRYDAPLGMFANFNRGIRAAKGEFIAFCHDDDVISPRFIEAQTQFLSQNPTVGFSGCNYRYIGHDGLPAGKRHFIPRTETWPGHHYIDLVYNAGGRCPLALQSVMFRARAISGQPFDETISPNWGDLLVLMRLAESWDVGVLRDSLVQIRNHPTQASKRNPLPTDTKNRDALLSAYIAEFRARHPNETQLIERMQRGLPRMYRIGMLRSWLLARDEAEGREARRALGKKPLDRAIALGLVTAEKLGCQPKFRQQLGRVLLQVASRVNFATAR